MARSPDLACLFQQPDSTAQRRYELCRASFLEGATADQLAQRFQLHVGTVRAVVHDFARDPDLNAFFATEPLSRKTAPKRQAIPERAGALRRQGGTLADIRATLQSEGFDVSESYLFRVLHRAGLTETRNRRPTPQPGEFTRDGSVVPDIADVRALSLEDGRRFSTKVAGLFLFLPMLLDLDLPGAVAAAGRPGSEQVPPLQALLALLTPKLLGKRRVSHLSDLCCDAAAGRFAGHNVLPKTTFATDDCSKTGRAMSERRVATVIGKTPRGDPPLSFHLDCHAIPFRGAEPDLEHHWVAMRKRALPAVRAFVAQASGRRIICNGSADLLRDEADAMVPKFADSWREPTGPSPARWLFDSRATTYAGLNALNQRKLGFLTLRRRGRGMLARVGRWPAENWGRCQVTQAKGKRRQIRYIDDRVRLDGSDGDWRQVIVTGLGHESPTFVLTNDLPKPRTAREAIQTYAHRNHVENHLGEQITFFHLDCQCSDVRLNVDFDRTLRVLADLLYRSLAERVKGCSGAGPARLSRKFVDTPGVIEVGAAGVVVRSNTRAHLTVTDFVGVDIYIHRGTRRSRGFAANKRDSGVG